MADAPDLPATGRHAYVTLVTNDDFALGGRALLRSLRLSGTAANLVVLHTGGVSGEALAPLAAQGARLVATELLPTSAAFNAAHAREAQHRAAPFTKGEKPAFHSPLDNFAKLRAWQLTEYERIVFLDADTLVLRNIDRLFGYPEFSAAPNVYESLGDFHRLNSGVFVARPSEATFTAMLAVLDVPGAFWRRTDQTFLQAFFPGWHGLPVVDNMLQYLWFNLPGLWDWGSIRVLHYQYEKPWQDPHPKAERLAPLIALWRAYAGDGPVPESGLAAGAAVRVAVTGGTGFVGRYIVAGLVKAGHEVTLLGRQGPEVGVASRPFDLRDPSAEAVAGAEALVHAALAHEPGRYRGGEGNDAAGFLSANLGGTVRLFEAARAAGVGRVVFLSSRAVYGDWPAGTRLAEDMEPRPDTLYGRVKLEGEAALARMAGPGFAGASLRTTGVYGPAGPGRAHKWTGLFAAFAQGEEIAPRVATEVHGADVASAVALFLGGEARLGAWNVSDIVLDRVDLLAAWAAVSGVQGRLPARADVASVSAMATERLSGLGWRPRGLVGLAPALRQMHAEAGAGSP